MIHVCTFKVAKPDYVFILLYVDDMLIRSRFMKLINALKEKLGVVFDMKDLGHAKKLLGMIIPYGKRENLINLHH